MNELTPEEALSARALALALMNVGGDLRNFSNSTEAEADYLSKLVEAGMPEDQASRVMASEIKTFSAAIQGDQFGDKLSEADPIIAGWFGVSLEDLQIMSNEAPGIEAPARKGRKASTPAAPPEPKEIPFGVEVGDFIGIKGTSWKGWVAKVTEVDPMKGWVTVEAYWSSGKEYTGRVRFTNVAEVIQKGGDEPEFFRGKPKAAKVVPLPDPDNPSVAPE